MSYAITKEMIEARAKKLYREDAFTCWMYQQVYRVAISTIRGQDAKKFIRYSKHQQRYLFGLLTDTSERIEECTWEEFDGDKQPYYVAAVNELKADQKRDETDEYLKQLQMVSDAEALLLLEDIGIKIKHPNGTGRRTPALRLIKGGGQ